MKTPQIIQEVGFDFRWDVEKVWQQGVPVQSAPIGVLTWHFDIPFLSKPGGFYDLKPQDVIDHPDVYPEEYARMINADTSYPIDYMEWRGRRLILDGLHRLMKLAVQGASEVQVRNIPQSAIPQIVKDAN